MTPEDKSFILKIRKNKANNQAQGKFRKDDFLAREDELSFRNGIYFKFYFKKDPKTFLEDEYSYSQIENFDAIPRKESIIQDYDSNKNKKDFSTGKLWKK